MAGNCHTRYRLRFLQPWMDLHEGYNLADELLAQSLPRR